MNITRKWQQLCSCIIIVVLLFNMIPAEAFAGSGTITVTFDTQGYTYDYSCTSTFVESIESGSLISKPADPTRYKDQWSPYLFDGWYTDKTYSVAWNFSTDTVTENITLYAKWKMSPPTFSVPGGIYTTEQHVFLGPSYYTNDGTDPRTSVTRQYFSQALAISSSQTIKATTWGYDADGNEIWSDVVTAEYEMHLGTFTVTYDGNGNTSGAVPTDGIAYNYGQDVTVLGNSGNLEKTNYSFAGWGTTPLGGTHYNLNDTLSMPGNNITLYAQWVGNNCTVTFDKNSGETEANPNTATVIYGNSIGLLPTPPAKIGWKFEGWNTKDDGSGTAFSATTAVIGDITVYAEWTQNNYHITYNGNGNIEGNVPEDTKSYTYNQNVTVLGNSGNLKKTGYTFRGWATSASESNIIYNMNDVLPMPDSDVILYAVWSLNNHSLTYLGNGNTGGDVPTGSITYHYGDTVAIQFNLKDLVKTGYSFDGWNTEANGSGAGYAAGNLLTMGDENITLYAQWTANHYNITYNGNGSTGGDIPVDNNSYLYGQSITALDNTGNLTKTGYTFNGWNSFANGSGTSYVGGNHYTMGAENITLYAQWTAKDYHITYDGNESTGGTVPIDNTAYHYEQSVSVHENTGKLTKTGFTFAGWNTSADGSGTGYSVGNQFIMGTQNITLYAQWTTNNYNVTYDGNGSTFGGIPIDNNNYHYEQSVTVLNNTGNLTKTGYTFDGWNTSADGSGTDFTGGNQLTMGTGNVTLYAQWKINSYTVTFNSDNGSANASQSVNYNCTVTKPINPVKFGYSFQGWCKDFSGSYMWDFDSDKVTNNITLNAVWVSNNSDSSLSTTPDANESAKKKESVKATPTPTPTPAPTKPEVETGPVSQINAEQATLNGAVNDDGGADINTKGFLCGTDANNLLVQYFESSGGIGTFSCELKNLTPDTTYYVKAFAQNSVETAYGELTSFKTLPGKLLQVETLEAINVTRTTATLQGKMAKDTGPVGIYGFVLKSPENGNTKITTNIVLDANGNFSRKMTGLQPGTTYYYMAFSENKKGTYNAEVMSFTTTSNIPVVETYNPEIIDISHMTLYGNIIKDNDLTITESGFLWGTEPNPEKKAIVSPDKKDHSLVYELPKNLEPGMTYYFQAYAVNSAGKGCGKIIQFKTPVAYPEVKTITATFDTTSPGVVNLSGELVSTGGNPITEYGFRYGTSQSYPEKKVIAGQGNYTGTFTAQIKTEGFRSSWPFYIQAYAVNTYGWTGLGKILCYFMPYTPTLEASINKSDISETKATIQGSILDTGGKPCTTRYFQFRLVGSNDWSEIGREEGTFKEGDFSYKLVGLTPATKYEFRVSAMNPAGWGTSKAITFITGFGATDKEAAVNMKAKGYNAIDIAKELKDGYKDKLEKAFEALYYAGFGAKDIMNALYMADYKGSMTLDTFTVTVGKMLKAKGFDINVIANAIDLYGEGKKAAGRIAASLNELDYGVDNIIKALRDTFGCTVGESVDIARVYSVVFSKHTIYGAVARVYGVDELTQYLWSFSKSWTIDSDLIDLAKILKEDVVLDASQSGSILMRVYPSIQNVQLAQTLRYAGYSVADTGLTLVKLLAYSSKDVGVVLFKARFSADQVEEYLIKDMNCSAILMVQIITEANSYTYPKEDVPKALMTYYHLDALAAAKAMYAAGWTGNTAKYNLDSLINVMIDAYGIKNDSDIIGILKELGLPFIEIADKMSKRSYDWLAACKAQGYTSIDAATWFKSIGSSKTISELARGNYTLRDIALALRSVYNMDADSTMNGLMSAASAQGWTKKAIAKAVSEAYGNDPIQLVINAMKKAGNSATQTAGTLKNGFEINDVDQVAEYLNQAGYSEQDILVALDYVFYNGSRSKATIESLVLVVENVFKQSRADKLADILSAVGSKSAEAALDCLVREGFNVQDVIATLKNGYAKSAGELISVLSSYNYRQYYTSVEVMTEMKKAYGVDPIPLYITGRIKAKDTVETITNELMERFEINDVQQIAVYLEGAGFKQEAVLTTLINVLYQGKPTADEVLKLSSVLKSVYGKSINVINIWLKSAGVTTPEQAIKALKEAGYTLTDIITVLKDIYNVTADSAVELLTESGLYKQEEIINVVETVYGMDYVLAYVQYKKRIGESAEVVYSRLFDELDISDSQKAIAYLKKAGYSDGDIFQAIISNCRYDIGLILKNVYNKSADEVVKQFNKAPFNQYYDKFGAIDEVQKAFPSLSTADVALLMKDNGYSVNTGYYSIRTWLRSSRVENGQHDDALAAILGTANPRDLGLEPHIAVEILYYKGYSIQETAAWLLKDNYTWPDMFEYLVNSYFPVTAGSSSSNVVPMLNALKDLYSMDDLAKGALKYYGGRGGFVYRDLLDVGYDRIKVIAFLMKNNEGTLKDLIAVMCDDGIERANAAHDPSLRMSATEIANTLLLVWITQPDISLTLQDIAQGLMDNGPNAGEFRNFSAHDVFLAMRSISAVYLKATGVSADVDITALNILRLAGLSADDAATIEEEEGVGISEFSVLKSMVGISNDWMDAVTNLAAAGYGFEDSIEAIWNNDSYHLMIGISVLSTMTLSAVGLLSASTKVKVALKAYGYFNKTGFMLNDLMKGDFKNAAIKAGIISATALKDYAF